MKRAVHKNQKGQIIIVGLIFFAILITFYAALMQYIPIYISAERYTIARAQALQLAEAGIDEAVYQLNQNTSYTGENNTVLGYGNFTVSVSSIDALHKRVTSIGSVSIGGGQTITRTVKVTIGLNSSVISFHYGIQAGNGGFTLNNTASIVGNVFSSGSIVGSGGSTKCGSYNGVGNCIYGDVVSAGPSGEVYGIHATGTVFSNKIGNGSLGTTIEQDAYYKNNLINTTVNGTSHPNSPDQGTVPLPISDDQITQWENQAALGTIINTCDKNGDYVINSSMTLGPAKILCNLVIKSSSGILDVTGPIWVVGNITTQTGPTVKMDSALGSQNVPIIADNPSNTTGSGILNIGQTSIFQGSGATGSFVFLISQNNSAEQGGDTTALIMQQGSSALVAYAAHGLATLSQSVNVKAVTAYKIVLSQSASVTYDTALPHTVFSSGPGGSWSYTPGSYVIQ